MIHAARAAVAAFAASLAASSCASSPGRAAAPPPPPAAARGDHPWPGTYHVVGTGFPDGARDAVLVIARRDAGYTMRFVQGGPPGRLLELRIAADSAVARWDVDDGEVAVPMAIAMRARGDSLSGTWETGGRRGALHGARHR